MPRLLLFLAIIGVTLYAVIDCAASEQDRIRTVPKPLWFVIIVLLPIIGPVLWFLLGRPRGSSGGTRQQRSIAPDDDPEFLRNLNIVKRQREEAERLDARKRELDDWERKLRDRDGEQPGSSSGNSQ